MAGYRENRLHKIGAFYDFLNNDQKDIEVFGMFGDGNLGDEAMLVAAMNTLPRGRAIACRGSRFRLLHNAVLARHRPHLLVAGGTLIHGGRTDCRSEADGRFRFGQIC